MIINFRQGIVKYPITDGVQSFLVRNGSDITLNVHDYRRVDVSFASGEENYLYTEINAISNAWQGVPNSVDVWLYWDLNVKTGLRTFGFTLVSPLYGSIRPTTPVEDQHWYDTVNHHMYVYTAVGGWIRKIRVFAAKVNTNTFTPLGADPLTPYAGTQVGIFGYSVDTSYITYDVNGNPIVRSGGQFLTLNTELFARGSSVNQVKLEANVVQLIATEAMARFSVVKLVDFDRIALAGYNDLTTSVVGVLMDDLEPDQLGRVVMQGLVYNQTWNWPTAGQYLWIHNGELTTTDMHVVDAMIYKQAEPPIARVISPTSILVTQTNESLTTQRGRTITGTPNQINVVNGDGVAGDPIISISDSPNLTGIPTAPTAPPGTDTAQIATTAFVNSVAGVKSVAGKTGVVTLVVGDVSGAAPLASPALTGIPTAPTALPGTSTTQLATTAFVTNAVASAGVTVLDNGTTVASPATSINVVGAAISATGSAVTVTVSGSIEVLDEGVSVSTAAKSIDFVGAAVTATDVGGGTITVDVSGGGGSISLLDDNFTDATYYPMFATAYTGTLTTAKVSSLKLQFMPVSGKLYATEFNSSSDARLKTNVSTISDALSTITSLRGVSFDWTSSGDSSYGVIAQEVEKIIPGVVSTTSEGVKSVNYAALIGFLVEGVKQLSDKVNELESRLK